MRRSSHFITACALLALCLSPSLGLAKAGDGASMGSRGARTSIAPPVTNTAPSVAQPMQRTFTPAPQPSNNLGMAPQSQSRPSFMHGVMGGLLLGGLTGMLFGGGLFHGMGGFFGFLIQMALLFFAGRFVLRLLFSRSGGGSLSNGPQVMPQSMMSPNRSAPIHEVVIGPADYQAFEQLLQAVQTAWSQHDVGTLRQIATPEMVSYFGEQLGEQTSRGERNIVSNVKLEQGDLSEAWAEDGREYATVAMRFSMNDVTVDSHGHVTAGDPNLRTMTTEIWTFLRAVGGRWILSAIQQVR